MKKILSFILAVQVLSSNAQQPCSTKQELDIIPGKHIDIAHYEWPAQKATWLNSLKNPTARATANKVLTQIENIEKASRKDFKLTGGVLKTSFFSQYTTWAPCRYGSSYDYARHQRKKNI